MFGHFCGKKQGQIEDHQAPLGAELRTPASGVLLGAGGFPQEVSCSSALKEEQALGAEKWGAPSWKLTVSKGPGLQAQVCQLGWASFFVDPAEKNHSIR